MPNPHECPFPHDISILVQEPIERGDLPENCTLCNAPLAYSEDLEFVVPEAEPEASAIEVSSVYSEIFERAPSDVRDDT